MEATRLPPSAQFGARGILCTVLDARFPAPLAKLMRSWADANRQEDITAGLDLLDAAMHEGRRGQGTELGMTRDLPQGRHDLRPGVPTEPGGSR